LEKVRQLGASQKVVAGQEPDDLRNILGHMRHFMYKRIDSLQGSLVYQWKTSPELKSRMMNQYKNGIELSRVIPRSVPLLEEMRRVINDEGWIGAEGHAKDDRVIAAALAYQGWNTWLQPKLKSQGLTLERSKQIDARGGTEPVDRLIRNFLKKQNIGVPANLEEELRE
jgi:hypothetical protein